MKFITSLVFFLSLCAYAVGQSISQADSIEITNKIDDWNRSKGRKLKWYSDTTYHFSANKDSSISPTAHFDVGEGVIIQNSYPKGGGYLDSTGSRGYTDSTGKNFGYGIFFTRVINETATPLELTINFPADSFAIFKLFLPPDTMTLDKESLYNYGISGLRSFLDTNFNKPTMLQRTINPKEQCLFYIVTLFHQGGGVARAALTLKEQDLVYKISLGQYSALIPCGQIVLKN